MIFGDIENGENVDFSRFYRTRYRTQNGGLGVETSDMPFLQSNICSKNVNHAPLPGMKIYYNSTVLQYIFCVTYILYIFTS